MPDRVGPFGTTYTVYLCGFEQTGSESGLSLTNAFRRVVSLASRSHAFEQRGEEWVLLLSVHNGSHDDSIRSDMPIESDAKREIMLKAADGRLSGFAAVPDDDFLEVRRQAAMVRHGT
jgi:hypothetical protein